MLPLQDIRVLDFSTLLPGPLASLILAEAGADVIKVERPGAGEAMRGYEPLLSGTGGGFALLNRGKRAIAVDLQAAGEAQRVLALASEVDVVIEQFRPGVMDRLGLGYQQWHAANPRIIYCAITGYGQEGPLARQPGHDLNYAAASGMLSLTTGAGGEAVLPHALVADIGGGAYPAAINILLALRQRERTGQGCFLDVAMADNLYTFLFWGLAQGFGASQWPVPGQELLTGGSPRYRLYPTADGRHVAVAPLEDKFWQNFCAAIGLPEALRDDARDPLATSKAIAERLAEQPASHWARVLGEAETCCTVVATLEEAVRSLHVQARGLFGRQVSIPGHVLPALPVPVASSLRRPAVTASAPGVGEHTSVILGNGQ
jgi:crotonobetainyl-CoA:carnitine CoA-transferase CaiB-like acyl-CoA transferase